MPNFKYVALARDGTETRGTESAASAEELARRLKWRRLALLKSLEVPLERVSAALTTRLASELADLSESGVTLEYALKIIAKDSNDRHLGRLAETLRSRLKGGRSLSQALAETGRFDPLLVPMIYAGEIGGQLPRTLSHLAAFYEEKRQLQGELLSTLAYPAILMVLSVVSLVGLAVYIIPVFRDVFGDEIHALPMATRATFVFSDLLVAHGVHFGLTLSALVLAAVVALRLQPGLRLSAHRAILRLPLAGALVAKTEAVRLLDVLSMLLKGGVPVARAMEIAHGTTANLAQQAGMEQAVQSLRQGVSLPRALGSLPALPILAMRLLTVGDESGRLAESCGKAARILRKDLHRQLKTLTALVEPVIILSMGAIIGFVVVSMLVAVFSLSDIAQ